MTQKLSLAIALAFSLGTAGAAQARANKVADAIWVDDRLFGTVLTPTSFRDPPPHSTDPLYNFMMSGLEGQRSIAESAPGDPAYNGGRWDVQLVVFTAQGLESFDADGDGMVDFEITNAEDLLAFEAAGDVEITSAGVFFECPLIP